MTIKKLTEQSSIIYKLKNSIRNTISGNNFQTETFILTKFDLKTINNLGLNSL